MLGFVTYKHAASAGASFETVWNGVKILAYAYSIDGPAVALNVSHFA